MAQDNVSHYKHNLKRISEEDLNMLNKLFETSRLAYNKIIYKYKNKVFNGELNTNSSIVKNIQEFKTLGPDLTYSIVSNFNINLCNFEKQTCEAFKDLNYRTKKEDFFVYFSKRRFKIENGICTIQLNKKTFSFKVSKNYLMLKEKYNYNIKGIRIHRMFNQYYAVIERFVDYKTERIPFYNIQNNISKKNRAGIDLGMNILIAVYAENNNPLLINGRPIKFINYKYDKKIAEAKSQAEINKLRFDRKYEIDSFFDRAVKRLFDYLNYANVKEIIIGDFKGVKEKKCARNFFLIPHKVLKRKIAVKAKDNGIYCHFKEESWTSQSSFLDYEPINGENLTGKRFVRGKFRTNAGVEIHSDINGAANILAKYRTINNRETALLKPFYLDMVSNSFKEKQDSRIKFLEFLRKQYKRQSTINKKIDKVYDFRKFIFKEFTSFNYEGKCQIVEYRYCRFNKRIVSSLEDKLEFVKNFKKD